MQNALRATLCVEYTMRTSITALLWTNLINELSSTMWLKHLNRCSHWLQKSSCLALQHLTSSTFKSQTSSCHLKLLQLQVWKRSLLDT